MSSVARNDNVRLFTLTEVLEVNGEPGNFTVKLKQNPRYVDTEKCTGCQKCLEVCPVEVTSEYDMGLGVRKAIYLPFPQAVPQIPRLDKDQCIDCGMCEMECPAEAI
jgi:heterodisulfide reductase subunit A